MAAPAAGAATGTETRYASNIGAMTAAEIAEYTAVAITPCESIPLAAGHAAATGAPNGASWEMDTDDISYCGGSDEAWFVVEFALPSCSNLTGVTTRIDLTMLSGQTTPPVIDVIVAAAARWRSRSCASSEGPQ